MIRRTRIAKLENAARALVGMPALRSRRTPTTVTLTPATEHDMAMPLRVMKSIRIGAAELAGVSHGRGTTSGRLAVGAALSGFSTVERGGPSRVRGGDDATTDGYKSGEGTADRVGFVNDAMVQMQTVGFGIAIGGMIGAPTGNAVDYGFGGALAGWAVGYALCRWRDG